MFNVIFTDLAAIDDQISLDQKESFEEATRAGLIMVRESIKLHLEKYYSFNSPDALNVEIEQYELQNIRTDISIIKSNLSVSWKDNARNLLWEVVKS